MSQSQLIGVATESDQTLRIMHQSSNGNRTRLHPGHLHASSYRVLPSGQLTCAVHRCSRLAHLCPLSMEDLMKHTVPGLSRNAMNRWGAALVEALRQGDAFAHGTAAGSGPTSVCLSTGMCRSHAQEEREALTSRHMQTVALSVCVRCRRLP